MTDHIRCVSGEPRGHEWIIESLINMAAYAEKYGLAQLQGKLVDVICEAASGELAKATRTLIDSKYLNAAHDASIVPFRQNDCDI